MSPRRPTVAFLLKPFMWCRLDAWLWPEFLFVYLSWRRSIHPIGFQLFILVVKSLLLYWALLFLLMTHSCMHLLYLLSELSCEYFRSTQLACCFGQMLMKAISWMKSSIASPTPRGVPVSPVRSCLGHCIIRFRKPRMDSSSLTSTLDVLPVEVKLSTTTFPSI